MGGDGSDGNVLAVKLGNGDGTFTPARSFETSANVSQMALADFNNDGVLDIVTSEFSEFTLYYEGGTQAGVAPVLDFSLKTVGDSIQAIGTFDRNLENLAKQRGTIGSYQSRISIALNNLSSSRETHQVAESRLKDADMALEAAALTKSQIVQQAAATVLKSVNLQPQLALRLLR